MVQMTESIPPPDLSAGDFADSLSTGVVLVSRAGLTVRYLNAAAEELLGVSRRRVAGQALASIADFGADWNRRLDRAADRDTALTARELNLTVPATGQRRLVDAAVGPARAGDGTELLVIEVSAVDRHRRIAREESLRAQEQANRTLLRGLAHEIRNPLAGLRGAAQLLQRELGASDLADHTGVIVREADRLRALVERLIGPARPLNRTSLNIHEVTERVAALLRAEAGSGVTVDTRYDPSIPPLEADSDRLIQAVLNLGRNALQAVGPDGRVTLRTSTRRQFTIGATLYRLVACVDIVDDGPGIPAELTETLFQPMVSGRPEGSGLGLTIAQSLVGQHGGLVECDSEPGETTFRVLLPIDRPGG